MKRLALLLLVACAAPPREVRKEPPIAPEKPPAPERPPEKPRRPASISEDTYGIEYRAQGEGRTLIEVASPPGSRVDVREGQALVGRDLAPMSVRAEGDHWYTVSARLPGGEAREVKVLAHGGYVASVRFVQSEPAGPQAMSHDEFTKFVHS